MQPVGTPRTTLAVSLSRARRLCGMMLSIRLATISFSSPSPTYSVAQSTQSLLTRAPETTSAEFEQAVDAASQAYKTWSRQSVLSRQRFAIESVVFCLCLCLIPSCPLRLQKQLRQNADVLAASIVLEQGKTLAGRSVFVFVSSNY
jgi:hypothetical protein